VEFWLGRILAKCESLSGKGRMNTTIVFIVRVYRTVT